MQFLIGDYVNDHAPYLCSAITGRAARFGGLACPIEYSAGGSENSFGKSNFMLIHSELAS